MFSEVCHDVAKELSINYSDKASSDLLARGFGRREQMAYFIMAYFILFFDI